MNEKFKGYSCEDREPDNNGGVCSTDNMGPNGTPGVNPTASVIIYVL